VITLAEAKAHVRVEAGYADEDDLIQALINTAILTTEHRTRRSLRSREEVLVLDSWATPIHLPWWPVQAVTEIAYTAPDGTEQTLPGYSLDFRQIPANVTSYPSSSWPEAKDKPMAITVKAQVGYVEIPADLKSAALLLIGHLYDNREAVVIGTIPSEVPLAYESLIQPYRIMRIC
jgi:uncharacterized phiE125 gp8 family phage protein